MPATCLSVYSCAHHSVAHILHNLPAVEDRSAAQESHPDIERMACTDSAPRIIEEMKINKRHI